MVMAGSACTIAAAAQTTTSATARNEAIAFIMLFSRGEDNDPRSRRERPNFTPLARSTLQSAEPPHQRNDPRHECLFPPPESPLCDHPTLASHNVRLCRGARLPRARNAGARALR